ncbi:MAG TPA: sulfatase [Verrucomicrobiae bacterium]|nr:sulfatase [Verrucomicrobiae bacterium]
MALSLGLGDRALADKPNVLFILVDDYGVKDVGIEGSKFYETPNIDALARSGMRFTQGYAACCVCSPSRASILLGQYTTRHGITDWVGEDAGAKFARERHTPLLVPDYARNLPANDTTLADAFKQAGYVTFFAGKWHLGSKGAWPEDRGFDINKGGWDAGSPMGGYYAPWKNPNLPNGPRGQSLTQRLADETISFLEQSTNKPFLAYLAFYAVHGPIETSKPLWEKFRAKAAAQPKPRERFEMDRTLPVRVVQDNPIYAGLIANMDNAVGRVLQKLDELGLASNTIVVLTGDNGGVVSGDSYSSCEFPFRGGKGRQWEGGTRVPFYIRAPGVTQPGSTCTTPVSGIDFFPTLLQLANVQVQPKQVIDGVSLVPLLNGGSITPRPLFWHYPHYGNQGGEPSSIVRDGDWKLIHYWEDGHNELYDLATDIGERQDLAKSEPQRTAELWSELSAWLKATNAKLPQPNPDYQPAWAVQQHTAALKLKERLEKQHAEFLDPNWQPDPTWWKSLTTKD